MPLVRLPFSIADLPAGDHFDPVRADEHPPTRPGSGGSRKVRRPRKEQP